MQSPSLPNRTLAGYGGIVDEGRQRSLDALADELGDLRVAHVNSTADGGGVAEMLRSIVPLSNDAGIDADWLVMEADERFFEVTKRLHNGLQGQHTPLTDEMGATYREVVERNASAFPGGYDVVVLHDPQPLGMIEPLSDRFPDTRFVWRCHVDPTAADPDHRSFVEADAACADRVVVSREEYGRAFDAPTTVVHPSIDPIAAKNRPLEEHEVAAEREQLEGIPLDVPLVTQVSRFDPWKDPLGVVEVFRRVRAAVPEVQLVLAGGMADDDPEGARVYERVAAETDDEPGVHLLTNVSDAAVNVLQRRSDVVLQKSLREGFGLVVSEALWKRTPVIGGAVGGIPLQIDDGENGFLVDPEDFDAAAERIVRLFEDDVSRWALAHRARETVRERFLLPRHLQDYLELFADLR